MWGEFMEGLSVKEVARELNVSDKAVYKRINNETFDNKYIKKLNGKTFITKDGVEFLKEVTRKKDSTIDEIALTSTSDNNFDIVKTEEDEQGVLLYSSQDLDIIKFLKVENEYLKEQLEKQNFNYQEQLRMQVELQKATILSMQEVIQSEQETSRKILDYEERSREVDSKLLQLRNDMNERKNIKKKKGILGFFKK